MSDQNNLPFAELGADEDLNIEAIFGSPSPEAIADGNIFDTPASDVAIPPHRETATPETSQQPTPTIITEPNAAPADPAAQPAVDVSDTPAEGAVPVAPTPAATPSEQPAAPPASAESNPIASAFVEKTVENTQKGLFEQAPIFCHKGAKEPIEDTSMTFEDLRIHKSEDFADLEEGKYVSWTVEYGTIRKDVKDPKGTTIAAMKETIERSREFLESLKKAKGKTPECLVKPRVVMKQKGTAASYKGVFPDVASARASDKVICLFPAQDGRFYEMHKTEQGEFIAPKRRISEFQEVRAGFTPALPPIPASLMGQVISFFRSFMAGHDGDYEALALIYWDKAEQRFLAYVPKQTVTKAHIDADLSECPYDDESRYVRYADIHSHNSMDAFFSGVDDRDERGTGLYMVLGHLENFYPDLKARICCGGTFVDIDPAQVVEPVERPWPGGWSDNVTCAPKKSLGKTLCSSEREGL